jgi:hypothetical protein
MRWFSSLIEVFLGPYLYWFVNKDGKKNYGDVLGPYLFAKLSKSKPNFVKSPTDRRFKYIIKNYLTIGSIISMANRNSVVWGSGIIKKDEKIRRANFTAVRGPYTRNRLIELGYNCPEIYGDPALLMPLVFSPKVIKRYKVGIIPHYVDYEKVLNLTAHLDNVLVINLITIDVEETTIEILSCHKVISSSLHGIIISQAYGIPAIWMKFSNNLAGDDVKFYDYYASVGIDYPNFIDARNEELLEVFSLIGIIIPNENLIIVQKQLLESCPFINKRKKYQLLSAI